jgi:MFS family permease
MKKPWLLALLAIAVAGIAIGSVWFLLVTYVMRSVPSSLEIAMAMSVAVVLVGLVAALLVAWRGDGGWRYRAVLAMMLIAGLAPWALEWRVSSIAAEDRKIEEANKKAEDQALEAKLLARLDTYKKDVAERIAAKNPYTPQQAKAFLDVVQESDLSRLLLPDYSPQAFALLKQALDGKVFDPNARVQGPRVVDAAAEPLFVGYYKFYLQSGIMLRRVREREWTLWQMLIAGGANLDDPAADVLRDDVKRETEPYEIKGYLAIK